MADTIITVLTILDMAYDGFLAAQNKGDNTANKEKCMDCSLCLGKKHSLTILNGESITIRSQLAFWSKQEK